MRESISTLLDLLTRSEFQTGLALGAIGLVVLALGTRAPDWARPWGLVTAVAVLIGAQMVDSQRLGLVTGVALMALGGWLAGPVKAPRASSTSTVAWRLLGWSSIAVGALLIPWRGQLNEDDWFFVATPVVAVGVGWVLSAWTASDRVRWLGPLFAVTSFAIWTTVPDTELARLLLGVSLPLAVATLSPISARLTNAGAFALAGVFAWVPALGGETRPASIIGAWTCIGMIAVVPVANVFWPERRPLGVISLFVLHAVLVLIAARVIGLWEWAVPAALAALVLYAATIALVHQLDHRSIASDPDETIR
jgi:hypothetical protein